MTEALLTDREGVTVTPGRAALLLLAAKATVAGLAAPLLEDIALLSDEQAVACLAELDLRVGLFWSRWRGSSWADRAVWLPR